MCRRRGGEGVVRGVVGRRVVGRRRSVHGRIRTPSLADVFKVKDASTAPAGDGVAQRARSPRVSRR